MNLKILMAIVIGTGLEYFDFLLFAHFSLILTPLFFPESDPLVASIMSLGLFAVGFIMRPLGGIIFGSIGDRLGRKQSLSASFIWIGLPTLVMGCLPTYAQAGLFAPIALLLCRIAQGLSLGGEYNNAGIFLMEHASNKHKGFYSSILAGAGLVGSIIALGCAFLVLHSGMPDPLWRIPFFLGAGMAFLGYRMRQILKETPEFKALLCQMVDHPDSSERLSWREILSDKRSFLIIMGIGALTGVLVWIPITYTNFYLTKIAGWTATQAMSMTLLAIVSYVLALPLMGWLGDRLSYRLVMASAAGATLLLALPLFFLLTQGHVVAAQIGFTLLAGGYGAAIHAVMTSIYPVAVRCRAISLGFSIGISIGGASPMVAAWLVKATGSDLSPAFYMMAIAVIGLWAALSYRPNMAFQTATPIDSEGSYRRPIPDRGPGQQAPGPAA